MATSLLNNCTYPNCVEKFSNLEDLIYHIEEDHIDFRLAEIEEQTEPQEFHCVPLSYVLKYSQLHPKLTHKKESFKKVLSLLSNKFVPVKHEAMMESESDDSINDGFNNFINYSRKFSFNAAQKKIRKKQVGKQTRKLLCPVLDCGKRYKNINGIKIHIKKIHNKEGRLMKPKKIHKCNSCGKLYKTINGLKTHSPMHKEVNVKHEITNPSTSQSSVGQSIHHSASLYIHQTDMLNKYFTSKSRIVDEDTLPYRLLRNEKKLSEIAEYKESESNEHFEIITPSFADGNFIFNKGFADGLVLEEANQTNELMKKKY